MITFLGRKNELKILSDKLVGKNPPTNLICISGETGIGKTSLAHQVLKTDELKERFEKIHIITAYMESDWDRFVTNLTRVLDIKLSKKITSKEILQKIFFLISEISILLLLDNIDELYKNCTGEVIAFIKAWLTKEHNSTLCLTIRDNPFSINQELNGCSTLKECYSCELHGITDHDSVKKLLGEPLTELIVASHMWDKLIPLGNNPQKLLYLRWWEPGNKKTLVEYIENIAKGLTQEKAIEMVLRKTRLPLVHFLALGYIRETEFDETLLAFLWDRLGGGSTEIYVKTLKFLLSENLLIQDNPHDRSRFRISAGVQIKLQQPLQMLVGVSQIHYFISVYYRNLFTYSREKIPEIHYLERYVYHALLFGAFDQAYNFVFESDILERAHNRGMALWLKPILENLNKHWSGLLQKDTLKSSANHKIAHQGIKIKIELGSFYNDLSQHKLCLECMEEAKEILNEPASKNITENNKREFSRDISYFSAISSSDLGRSLDCLNYYYQITREAINSNEFTRKDILALGYLAHELKFHHMDKAKLLGDTALQLVKKYGEADTEIKNMCSLGQTLFFMGEKAESKKIFDEAYRLSTEKEIDSRELGRILIHSSVVYIAYQDLEEAKQRLEKGLILNEKFGDRRRASTAEAYYSILLYKEGDWDASKEKMMNAIRQHMQIDDWRNLTNDVLTYVWMIEPGLSDQLLRIIKRADSEGAVSSYLPLPKVKKKGAFDVFLSYNSSDKDEVRKIWVELKNGQVSPWWDEEIEPGFRFEEVLEEVISMIPTAVVFIGKKGVSPWQRNEIHAYIKKYKVGEGSIIPVILPDCGIDPAVPLSLQGFAQIDFSNNKPLPISPIDRLIEAITGRGTGKTVNESPHTSTFAASLQQLFKGKEIPPEINQCLTHIYNDKLLHIFVDFWEKYFKPQLLGK